MKKLHNLKIAATCLIIAVVVTTACNKITETPVTNSGDGDLTELLEKSKAMQKHVEAFKAKMEYYRDNPGVKSGGSIYSADSGAIELESLLNYNFCYTGIECNKKTFVTSEVTMPLDDLQKINDPKLMEVYYDKVIDTIQAQMNRVNYNNMKLLLVDLEVTNYDSNDDAIISVGALIGNQAQSTLHNNNWWYGEYMGLYPSGQYAPEDAASQLMHKVDNALEPTPPSNGRWTFHSIDYSIISPTSDPLFGNNPRDNYRDYKIFYATEEVAPITNNEKHLPYAEMNFYYNHYYTYALNYANSVSEKEYRSCTILGLPGTANGYYYIYHDYIIFIGVKILIMDTGVNDILIS